MPAAGGRVELEGAAVVGDGLLVALERIQEVAAGGPGGGEAGGEAQRLAGLEGFVLLAGRYEGIDERLIENEVDEELSLGDFVLSGGEIVAMAVVDAVTRLLPGVLGDDESAQQDSFMQGLLDCPHYTRPEQINDQRVPDVLTGGDHKAIQRWRLKQALVRTWLRRPDLLEAAMRDASNWNEEKAQLLAEFQKEYESNQKR